MKTLVILRHAKAEISDFSTDDYDRSLTDRGKKDASDMAVFINQKIGVPDLILASDAKRTTYTAVLAAENINYPKEKIEFSPDLYLASARRILKVISTIPAEVKNCVIVGHNPGLTDLINHFGVKLDNLPTASAVFFEFKANNWAEISSENGKFKWIQLSKKL